LQIKSLAHKNYRGLYEERVVFKKVNHVVGNNGTGKTSLIEAMVLLLNGRSFLGSTTKEIVNKNKSSFQLAGEVVQDNNTTDKITLSFSHNKKIHQLNNKRLGQQHAHQRFPLCLIDTNSISASSGTPTHRRDLLDRAVFHVEPQHAKHHKTLKKCLSQRNKALRRGEDKRSVQSWDEQLAEVGEKISEARREMLNDTIEQLGYISKDLLNNKIGLQLKQGWEGKTYLESLKKTIEKDYVLKTTSSGPQKDDFNLVVKNTKTKGFYSHGQEKLAAVSLILALNFIIEERKKTSSIVIIDEAESGLDNEANNRLLNLLKSLTNQLVITSLSHHKVNNKIQGNLLYPKQI